MVPGEVTPAAPTPPPRRRRAGRARLCSSRRFRNRQDHELAAGCRRVAAVLARHEAARTGPRAASPAAAVPGSSPFLAGPRDGRLSGGDAGDGPPPQVPHPALPAPRRARGRVRPVHPLVPVGRHGAACPRRRRRPQPQPHLQDGRGRRVPCVVPEARAPPGRGRRGRHGAAVGRGDARGPDGDGRVAPGACAPGRPGASRPARTRAYHVGDLAAVSYTFGDRAALWPLAMVAENWIAAAADHDGDGGLKRLSELALYGLTSVGATTPRSRLAATPPRSSRTRSGRGGCL